MEESKKENEKGELREEEGNMFQTIEPSRAPDSSGSSGSPSEPHSGPTADLLIEASCPQLS
jgi:hypothetical protein